MKLFILCSAIAIGAFAVAEWSLANDVTSPALELTFDEEASIYEMSMGQFQLFSLYVRRAGPDFEYAEIAFDLQLPSDGTTSLIRTESWPLSPLCDFPPYNWCIGYTGCKSSVEQSPILVKLTWFTILTPHADTLFCLKPPSPFWLSPASGPAYRDCGGAVHEFEIIGGIADSLPGCVVLNSSSVASDGISWSKLRALY